MSELQMMHIANVCDGYDSIDTGFVSVIGAKTVKAVQTAKTYKMEFV
ncbi:hypothetical protein JTT01_19995 [Clostridium botulinum]|nr:hypothetical protein [Clostridium botulinum]MCS4465263.1 hypothetical protein [Clostridium botulinum]MCS4467275.1 hypothetical protein [Clostridium botulinum]MCS4468388.1 hypothetical protein [Clostridium botulinum]MCS4478087.1 hypothetical protein [Clostridium botulinum]